MPEVFGNTTGLAPSALKALERIYRRRVPLDRIATPELVRSLAEASRETGRQVGALVHRSGDVDTVVVGSPTGLMLPDIGRLRAARGRFRALRLVHTHLFNEPLTRDDLVDLTRLRLDLVAAVLLTLGPWLFALVFGAEWEPAGRFARLLALPIAAQFVVVPLAVLLNALGRIRQYSIWQVAYFAAVLGCSWLPFQGPETYLTILAAVDVLAFGALGLMIARGAVAHDRSLYIPLA